MIATEILKDIRKRNIDFRSKSVPNEIDSFWVALGIFASVLRICVLLKVITMRNLDVFMFANDVLGLFNLVYEISNGNTIVLYAV